ncbi:calcium-binding protein [Roseicella aquatilis]|uniref:Calcium-binding protein n=1 Tax=Roseicella aquatilis TaxID=2527868 RepID=A0A4R4DV12_9PROT|nr:calcium-binding protein [Roseicella aquatilis]TCZ64293.1 calcium-binding protein [Roseicella aquatilis]
MVDLVLGPDDDIRNGSQQADTIRGGGGDDTLRGLAGDDLLDGEEGDDQLFGGSGNDVLLGGASGADRLGGGSGADSLDGGNNDDTLVGGTGDDTLDGGTGDDLLYGSDDADLLRGGTGDDALSGGGENDLLIGGPGRDTVSGGDNDDSITWEAGDGVDRIDGGSGTDALEVVGFASLRNLFRVEVVDGRQVIELRQQTGTPPFPLEVRLDDVRSIERLELRGGAEDDSFSLGTSEGSEIALISISAGAGDDFISGGGGPLDPARNSIPLDAFGGLGNDAMFGSFAGDTLDGGFDNDRLDGQVGDDLLLGGVGNDTLDGGFNGSDTLDGGTGSDLLIGGARDAADTFRFRAEPAQGDDIIQDFEAGDRIELSGVTQAQLDTDGNGRLDAADGPVSVFGGSLRIDMPFPLSGSLQVFGFGGAPVTSLDIGSDVFFLV